VPIGDIATTKQFVNGQLGVDGADMNAIIGQASIQPAFYSAQSAGSSPGDSDYLLLLSAGGSYYKILYPNFFTNQKWVQQALLPFVSTVINGDMSVWQWAPASLTRQLGAIWRTGSALITCWAVAARLTRRSKCYLVPCSCQMGSRRFMLFELVSIRPSFSGGLRYAHDQPTDRAQPG
jgi:hypothetical protein